MLKSKNKNDNKIVGSGLGPVRPKQNRGITLIALIITIIVMLILVAVTINVVLDTGLFDKAKEGANKTEVEADREILQGAVVGAVDKQELIIKTAQDLLNNLPNGWEVTGVDGGPYTVTSPNENIFTVDSKGNIAIEGEKLPEQDLDLLERYFLGEDKTGKNFTSLMEYDGTFKDDENIPELIASNIHALNSVETGYEAEGESIFNIQDMYIKYNNKAYAVRVKINNETSEMLTTTVEYKYTPQSDLEGRDLGEVTGKTEYNGWTILYDYGNGTVEAVSPKEMGKLTLGAEDSIIDNLKDEEGKLTEEGKKADIDNSGELEDVEKAIYSYNNAIETINNYCKTLEGLPKNEGVRSVGAKEDPIKDITIPGNAFTKEDILGYNEETNHWFDAYDGKGKASDTEYEQDFIRMSYYGVAEIVNEWYWDASRIVKLSPFGGDYDKMLVGYYVRFVSSPKNNMHVISPLWVIGAEFGGRAGSTSYAVRPIIKVSGIQNP